MNDRKTVLITGAEGNIGTRLRTFLADADGRYDVRCLTRDPVPDLPSTVADVADLEAILPAFDGVRAVVHLAASAAVDSPWEDVLHNNIAGAYNVFEAARRAGTAQVVFASSNHAVGGHELDVMPAHYRRASGVMLDHQIAPRPDSLYGVSKAYGEALGRYVSDLHGLSVYCLRIGSVLRNDDPLLADGGASQASLYRGLTRDQMRRRYAATWLSHRDLGRLIDACLRAEHVRFGIYYGVSNNPYRFWSVDNAFADLGWRPQDAAPEPDPGR